MTTETETNPNDQTVDEGDLLTAEERAGVHGAQAPEPPEPELDENGNPITPDNAAAADEETEEVEHDGKKAKIPAWLKPAMMMQADYTKKTQEVAEQRRTVESQAQELATRQQSFAQTMQQHTEAQDKLVSARAELVFLDQNITAYDQLIQQAEGQGNFDEAHRLRFLRQDLKDAKLDAQHKVNTAQGELSETQQRAQTEVQAQRRAAIETGVQALQNDPDVKLSKPVFDAVASHLQQNFGIGPQELFDTLNDPRVFKVAKAFADQTAELTKLRAENASLKKTGATTQARPAQTVRGASPAGKDPDKMSMDEWMRAEDEREAQERKRGANGRYR